VTDDVVEGAERFVNVENVELPKLDVFQAERADDLPAEPICRADKSTPGIGCPAVLAWAAGCCRCRSPVPARGLFTERDSCPGWLHGADALRGCRKYVFAVGNLIVIVNCFGHARSSL